MRGMLNIIAASGGSLQAAAGDAADFQDVQTTLPVPVFLGAQSVTVAGGATPTNATITLAGAVPGVGASATVYDDEFATAGWQAHSAYQSGDKWAYGSTETTPAGVGQSDGSNTWWANAVSTPQAATVYPPPSGGALSLGLMSTPTGIGISQAFTGTLINNQQSGGLRLFGYHEMRVKVSKTSGFQWHWDIEDYPVNATWSVEIDLDIWTDASGTANVRFGIPAGTPALSVQTTIYQTTTLDITQYHVYGVNWQSDHITAYIDGKQVGQILNPGGDFISKPCYAYFLTSAASYVGDGVPTAASLPTFAQIDYYRIYSNLPSTAGSVIVHAYNAGGSANTITDSVGQAWVRHPDARIGSPPMLTAITNNTLPMAIGSTITVGFTNANTNTPATAAAWYVQNVNGSSFGSLANVGTSGAVPVAPSITAALLGNTGATVYVTLPTTGPALDTGAVQVLYRQSGTTQWSSAPAPPTYCTLATGSVIDGFGNTWSIAASGGGQTNAVMVNGSYASGYNATMVQLIAGTVYHVNTWPEWYSYTPSGVVSASAAGSLVWPDYGATPPLVLAGIQINLPASSTQYDIACYVSNSAGVGTLSAIVNVTTPAVITGSTGPAATGTLITMDCAVTTGASAQTIDAGGTWSYSSGQYIYRTIWGVATGAMADFDFTYLGNSYVQTAMQQIPFSLYRWNGLGEFYECFSGAGSVANPIWTPLANLIANASKVFPPDAVHVFGMDYNPTAHFSTTDYQTACGKFATYLHANFPFKIIGWEIGNELVGDGSAGVAAATYASYFNAAVAGINTAFPNDLFFGPVGSDVFGITSTFVSSCGAHVGAYDFHMYGQQNGSSAGTNWGTFGIGTAARSYGDTVTARGIIGNNTTPIANLEYAGDATADGSQVWQTQLDGAIFATLWNIWNQDVPNGNTRFNAIWDLANDTQYGQIGPGVGPLVSTPSYWQGSSQPSAPLKIVPSGWTLSRLGQWLYGNRCRVTLINTANQIALLAVTGGPNAGQCALVAVNMTGQNASYSGTAYSGTIGFSHWPFNGNGNGTMQMWQMTSASNNGTPPTPTTLTITGGVTPSITLPAATVTIFSNIQGTAGTASALAGAAFADDFTTLSLYNFRNTGAGGNWQPAQWYSPGNAGIANGSTWLLDPNNPATPISGIYSVSNSILSLGYNNTPSAYLAACGNCPFVGGQLTTYNTFTQEYGYWEIRCSSPPFKGIDFAFDIYDSSGATQIDIIELVTDAGGNHFGKFSLWDPTAGPGIVGQFYTSSAFGPGPATAIDVTQMHAYGVKVTSTTVTFYIDRVAQQSWPTPSGYALNLAINMGIFNDSGWLGPVTPTTSLPMSAAIDYVGVWTLANSPV